MNDSVVRFSMKYQISKCVGSSLWETDAGGQDAILNLMQTKR